MREMGWVGHPGLSQVPFCHLFPVSGYKDYLEPITWTWLQVCFSENLTLPRWPGTVATLKGF